MLRVIWEGRIAHVWKVIGREGRLCYGIGQLSGIWTTFGTCVSGHMSRIAHGRDLCHTPNPTLATERGYLRSCCVDSSTPSQLPPPTEACDQPKGFGEGGSRWQTRRNRFEVFRLPPLFLVSSLSYPFLPMGNLSLPDAAVEGSHRFLDTSARACHRNSCRTQELLPSLPRPGLPGLTGTRALFSCTAAVGAPGGTAWPISWVTLSAVSLAVSRRASFIM